MWFYYVFKMLSKIYFSILFKVDIVGEENIPKSGGAIICSNHMSNYDPVILGAFMKRLPRFMAKKELFENHILNWALTNLQVFPVDRENAGMETFRKTIKILKSGEMIGIFAQGKRVKKGEESTAKAGVALFSLKSNAPVIPVCIIGNYKMFSKIVIRYGEPITLDEYKGKKIKGEEMNQIAEYIMEKINVLKEN